MELTKFIDASDLHFRMDRPKCRIDEDWLESQGNILRFILDTAREFKLPLVLNGDIFHRAVSGIELVYWVLSILQEYSDVTIYAIPGNHDLPYHNMDNISRSAYGILDQAGVFERLPNMFPFGWDTPESVQGMEVIFIHRLIMEKDPGFRLDGMTTAGDLLDMYPDAKWIFTGDNHDGFVFKRDNRYVINPGATMRQSAGQKNYQPRMYLIDLENELVDVLNIPDPIEMFDADYIIEEKDRDVRIQEFVDQMKLGSAIGMSFEDNLELYYSKAIENKIVISQDVKDIIGEVAV